MIVYLVLTGWWFRLHIDRTEIGKSASDGVAAGGWENNVYASI